MATYKLPGEEFQGTSADIFVGVVQGKIDGAQIANSGRDILVGLESGSSFDVAKAGLALTDMVHTIASFSENVPGGGKLVAGNLLARAEEMRQDLKEFGSIRDTTLVEKGVGAL